GVVGMASDGDLAERATLNNPFGLVIGPDGALYWAEFGSHRILRLDLGSRKISIVAGTGAKGYSGDGGTATRAQLNTPHEVRFDAKTGLISTFAGNGTRTPTPEEGPLADTSVTGPRSIDVAPDGKMYLVLREGNKLFVIDPVLGRLKHLAGTGELGYAGDGGP